MNVSQSGTVHGAERCQPCRGLPRLLAVWLSVPQNPPPAPILRSHPIYVLELAPARIRVPRVTASGCARGISHSAPLRSAAAPLRSSSHRREARAVPHADPRPSFPKSRSQGSEQAATGFGLLARRGRANWRRREKWSGTSLHLFLRNQELAPVQLVQLQREQYIFPPLFNQASAVFLPARTGVCVVPLQNPATNYTCMGRHGVGTRSVGSICCCRCSARA